MPCFARTRRLRLARLYLSDAAFRTHDVGRRERVPVAVVNGLPGFPVVARDVGAVGSGGDPYFAFRIPRNRRAVAVRRLCSGRPVQTAIARPRCRAGCLAGLFVVPSNGEAVLPITE